MLEGIHWLGHASFRIDGDQTIYIDPWKLREPQPADLILITHGHHDHLSPEDIARVAGPKTVVVCPEGVARNLAGDVRHLCAGESLQVGSIHVSAVPSYNTDKPNHPREQGNVGYVVTAGSRSIYHAGDTDLIPEMANVSCDVALLPVGGTYTMNAQQAAQALGLIRPSVAIPMHWGDIVGSKRDAQEFARLAPVTVKVVIMKPE